MTTSEALNAPTRYFRDQLDGYTLIEAPVPVVVDALADDLARFGPVARQPLKGLDAAEAYLTPLKSFPTRFVVLDAGGGWSVLLSDAWAETGAVQGYAVSRRTGCRVVAVSLHADRRELRVYADGRPLRSVLSTEDGDRWCYQAGGTPLSVEDPADATLRPASRRLGVERAAAYVAAYAGRPPLAWDSPDGFAGVGLERSTSELKVPLLLYPTVPRRRAAG